jgi:hypothetical protein
VIANLAKTVVEVREVIERHVSNERASDFVIARAAVQPANEEK